MIVSLIRTSPLEEHWLDTEHEFAYFLAHKMSTGPKGTMHDINAFEQITACEMLNSKSSESISTHDESAPVKQRVLYDETVKASKIVDICNSDILVIDVPVRGDKDLENLMVWSASICQLNSILADSSQCNCAFLNNKKKVYVMVTIGLVDEPAERAKARKVIRQALSRIKITNPVIFFRCFDEETTGSVDGTMDSIPTLQSNSFSAGELKSAIYH